MTCKCLTIQILNDHLFDLAATRGHFFLAATVKAMPKRTDAEGETTYLWLVADLLRLGLKAKVTDTVEEWLADGEARVASFQDTVERLLNLQFSPEYCLKYEVSSRPALYDEWDAKCLAVAGYELELRSFGTDSDGRLRVAPSLEILDYLAYKIAYATKWYWSAMQEAYEGKYDPDVLCRLVGGKGYEAITEKYKTGWMNCLINEGLSKGYQLDDPISRLEIAKAVSYRIAMIEDGLLRDMETAELATKIRVPKATVARLVAEYGRAKTRSR